MYAEHNGAEIMALLRYERYYIFIAGPLDSGERSLQTTATRTSVDTPERFARLAAVNH